MTHLPPQKQTLVKTINITFICLLVPFSVQNLKKILRVDPELLGWAILGAICPKQ